MYVYMCTIHSLVPSLLPVFQRCMLRNGKAWEAKSRVHNCTITEQYKLHSQTLLTQALVHLAPGLGMRLFVLALLHEIICYLASPTMYHQWLLFVEDEMS